MADFADLIDLVDATAKSLLGGELIVSAATLTKFTPGTRTPGAENAGTNPTSVTYACEGIVQRFDAGMVDADIAQGAIAHKTIVRREDRRISLLIATLPADVEPKPGDKITIQGATYVILDGVERDPASFMFTCHGRK
jgi:hypothetical protein